MSEQLNAMKQEPVNWSVYNSGAEVASGLTFAEAWDYMTPERLARDWCAVCVVDQSNMPMTSPAAPTPREHITDKSCWCQPVLDYKDPDTGAEVWVHNEPH